MTQMNSIIDSCHRAVLDRLNSIGAGSHIRDVRVRVEEYESVELIKN